MRLSARQQVLADRLVMLGQWASAGKLPIEVTEIIGFGSFFRGKDKPKDVDLLIRHSREHSQAFLKFRKLVEVIRTDETYDEKKFTPQEALETEYEKGSAEFLPGIIDHDAELQKFSTWIESYSWRMLYPETIADELDFENPVSFTRRTLRKHFPNLNVIAYPGPDEDIESLGFRCGFFAQVWSRESPQVESNLEQLLSKEHTLEFSKQELASFTNQEQRLKATADQLLSALKLLLNTRRSRSKSASTDEWLNKWLKRQDHMQRIAEHRLSFLYLNCLPQFEELGIGTGGTSIDECDTSQLGEIVEGKRLRIKQLWAYVEACREAVWTLAAYKSRHVETTEKAVRYLANEISQSRQRDKRHAASQLLADLEIAQPANPQK